MRVFYGFPSSKPLCIDMLEEGLDIFDLALGTESSIDGNAISVLPENGALKAGEAANYKIRIQRSHELYCPYSTG